jgi:hypothetical protein
LPEADTNRPWLPEPNAALRLPGDQAEFLGDLTIPAGTILRRGDYFAKTWRLRNSGVVDWRDRLLRRVGPNAGSTPIGSVRAVKIPLTKHGQQVDITLGCRAQWIPPTAVAHFKMTCADGSLAGLTATPTASTS